MANSRKSTRKTGNVTQLPGPADGVGVGEPPEEAESPAEAATEAVPTPPLRPPKKTAKDQNASPSDPNFFQRLKAIPIDDWGSRVYLYLYVLEPLCNLKQSGGKTYLNRYSEPVQDEHQIMLEYGSGRYRLMLSQNKVSPEGSNELARHEFEVLNVNYPPKIPRACWVNDSRNAKWEAMLPKETQPGSATAASTIVEAMKMVGDIRRDVREEMDPGETEQTRTSEVLETMRAAKELFGTPANSANAQPLSDPFEIAAKMNAARANDPMIPVLMQLLKDSQASNEAARAREYELLKERATTPPSKSFMEQALELANDPAKLEPLKKLASAFGFGGGEATGRAGRTTGMDILNNLVSGPAGEALARGAAQLLITIPSMLQPNPANGNGQPQQQPQVLPPVTQQAAQETPEQRIHRIASTITRPMIAEWFMKDATGAGFAQWMNDSWPDDYQFIKLLGAENLIQRYRNSPVWPAVSFREKEFIAFMQEFCAWTEPKEDGNGEPAPPSTEDGTSPAEKEDDF